MDSEAFTKKQTLQGVFDRAASTYGGIRYFPFFGQWLVDQAQIPAGAHVLDLACGRGAVLFPAARRVGPRGRVVGIDLAGGMVQETGAAIAAEGLDQAKVLQMDAERLEFPDTSFDFVLCGFALQFLPDLDRALSEFRRVLKPAGQAAVTTWGEDDPRWSWYDDLRLANEAVVKLASQSLNKREDLFDRFGRAGFTNIQIDTKEVEMIFVDEEEWWTAQWSISGRAGLERLAPKRLEQFKAEVFERMQALRQPDGFPDRLQAHCTMAVKS